MQSANERRGLNMQVSWHARMSNSKRLHIQKCLRSSISEKEYFSDGS